MSNRFELINFLNAHDNFRDNENKEDLDSFDVVRILNHYDKTLSEFVKREVEKQDKIADLEAKLTEKERENKDLHTAINLSIPNQIAMKDEIERLHTCRDERISELAEENEKLKQQLAEKDAELEEVKRYRTQILNFGKRTKKVVIANPYGEDCVVYNQEDQDKISFCIDQLEKVKEKIQEDRESLIAYAPISGSLMVDGFLCDVRNFINQLIKELQDN